MWLQRGTGRDGYGLMLPAAPFPATMTFVRFQELWTALVTNRASAATPTAACKEMAIPMSNGVSEHTVDALIAAASDDFSAFDKIQELLALDTQE
jgi:hypothetical protein